MCASRPTTTRLSHTTIHRVSRRMCRSPLEASASQSPPTSDGRRRSPADPFIRMETGGGRTVRLGIHSRPDADNSARVAHVRRPSMTWTAASEGFRSRRTGARQWPAPHATCSSRRASGGAQSTSRTSLRGKRSGLWTPPSRIAFEDGEVFERCRCSSGPGRGSRTRTRGAADDRSAAPQQRRPTCSRLRPTAACGRRTVGSSAVRSSRRPRTHGPGSR